MACKQAIWKKSAKRDRNRTATCVFRGMLAHDGAGGALGVGGG